MKQKQNRIVYKYT